MLASADNKPLQVSEVLAQQQSIRAEVQAGKGRYKAMPSSKREELLARQTKLMQLLDGKQTSSDLTEAQRVEAFNTLEWIEAAINRAEDERTICEREQPTGSHRTVTRCRTVAQIREEREAAEKAVDRRAVCSQGDMCTGK
ncbi:MAG: hypothetical protein ABIO58_01310 [Luteimonas sp.]